jgi:hypothetical protein
VCVFWGKKREKKNIDFVSYISLPEGEKNEIDSGILRKEEA